MAVAVANRLDDGMARTWARHGYIPATVEHTRI